MQACAADECTSGTAMPDGLEGNGLVLGEEEACALFEGWVLEEGGVAGAAGGDPPFGVCSCVSSGC